MGITGLLPFLKDLGVTFEITIEELKEYLNTIYVKYHDSDYNDERKLVAAIDAHSWLHKAICGCGELLYNGGTDNLEKARTIYVNYCMKYITLLKQCDIEPIMVFDGASPPPKIKYTNSARKLRKAEARKRASECVQAGDLGKARQYFNSCVDVTFDMVKDVIKACCENEIPYIVAPYEADAQMAYLQLSGIADFVITEDSDLVVFGCERVLFKLDMNGTGTFYEKRRLLETFQPRENNNNNVTQINPGGSSLSQPFEEKMESRSSTTEIPVNKKPYLRSSSAIFCFGSGMDGKPPFSDHNSPQEARLGNLRSRSQASSISSPSNIMNRKMEDLQQHRGSMMGFDFVKFQYMCIMSGCDYLPSIPNVGLQKARRFFGMPLACTDITKLIPKIPVYLKMPPKSAGTNNSCIPDGYVQNFVAAHRLFLYQTIFDPSLKRYRPLHSSLGDLKRALTEGGGDQASLVNLANKYKDLKLPHLSILLSYSASLFHEDLLEHLSKMCPLIADETKNSSKFPFYTATGLVQANVLGSEHNNDLESAKNSEIFDESSFEQDDNPFHYAFTMFDKEMFKLVAAGAAPTGVSAEKNNGSFWNDTDVFRFGKTVSNIQNDLSLKRRFFDQKDILNVLIRDKSLFTFDDDNDTLLVDLTTTAQEGADKNLKEIDVGDSQTLPSSSIDSGISSLIIESSPPPRDTTLKKGGSSTLRSSKYFATSAVKSMMIVEPPPSSSSYSESHMKLEILINKENIDPKLSNVSSSEFLSLPENSVKSVPLVVCSLSSTGESTINQRVDDKSGSVGDEEIDSLDQTQIIDISDRKVSAVSPCSNKSPQTDDMSPQLEKRNKVKSNNNDCHSSQFTPSMQSTPKFREKSRNKGTSSRQEVATTTSSKINSTNISLLDRFRYDKSKRPALQTSQSSTHIVIATDTIKERILDIYKPKTKQRNEQITQAVTLPSPIISASKTSSTTTVSSGKGRNLRKRKISSSSKKCLSYQTPPQFQQQNDTRDRTHLLTQKQQPNLPHENENVLKDLTNNNQYQVEDEISEVTYLESKAKANSGNQLEKCFSSSSSNVEKTPIEFNKSFDNNNFQSLPNNYNGNRSPKFHITHLKKNTSWENQNMQKTIQNSVVMVDSIKSRLSKFKFQKIA